MILPIVYYGSKILRTKCTPVDEITNEIKQFIHDMHETMKANHGVGLSACQVGQTLRIFIAEEDAYDENGYYRGGEPIIYINPVLSDPSDEVCYEIDPCISIPGIYEKAARPVSVTVEALDLEGKPFKKQLEGLNARVVMHENDHLNGVLCIDRMSPKIRKKIEPALRSIKKKYQSKNLASNY